MVAALQQWGVDTIFGILGDGINGIMESLRQVKDKIRFVQVRHEESAAFMACAYAKYTGRLGVCLATSGPGGIHLLNGLYDAKMDGQPVLAITGHHYHDLIDTHQQQDAEACGGRGFKIDDPKDCGRILDLALATPGPVIIEAVVDPFEPPMPAKIEPKQALHFAESLLRGEPNREKIALTTLSDRVREMI
jgi:thiamine pyrophosphate-dependent acetolactate synthase large subunit-like protein